jgi:magnesium chelatase family protein
MRAAEGTEAEEGTEVALNRVSGAIIGAAIEVHKVHWPAKARRSRSSFADLIVDAAVLDSDGHRLLERAVERLALSARAIERVRRLARTTADMEGSACVRGAHVAEALTYRSLDREVT